MTFPLQNEDALYVARRERMMDGWMDGCLSDCVQLDSFLDVAHASSPSMPAKISGCGVGGNGGAAAVAAGALVVGAKMSS